MNPCVVRADPLNRDLPVKNEIGRPFERHILEIIAIALEPNFQRIAALNLHLHGRVEIVKSR